MSYTHTCEICGKTYEAKLPHQKRCSAECTAVANLRRSHAKSQTLTVDEWRTRSRFCRWCGKEFHLENKGANNKQYCSPECQTAGYGQSVKEFHERNPKKHLQYNRTRVEQHGRVTFLERLRKRFPDLPTACESCGEARVTEIAHKPAHARNGAFRTLRLYQRNMFWILCPTCHKLIDLGICLPAELGLKE